jgi:Tfp pilus assembly protein PilF
MALLTLMAGEVARAGAPPADRALAQSLFDEGRKLMQAGQLAEACAKLEKSEALDPSGGTLLNLALCHEQQGKTASAWTEYHDALALARADKRDEREEFAQKHIAALEPLLSRLVLKVALEALPPGFEILRNGAPTSRAGWNASAPIDPGPQQITARAPGYESWSVTLVVGDRADEKTVEVPALRRTEGAPAATLPPPEPPAPLPAQRRGFQRPLGFTLLGVGLAAVAVGAGFGVNALAQDGTAHTDCGSDATCASPQGLVANRDAQTSAKAADGLLFGGLALAGVGLTVALTAKTGGQDGAPAQASVFLAPRRAGLAVSF